MRKESMYDLDWYSFHDCIFNSKVTKTYFETEGERVYFFEPLDEEMTITELQEMMDEHEKFVLETIQKMKKEKINGND